jgi:tetratricopeptide (TPR) repeat protein
VAAAEADLTKAIKAAPESPLGYTALADLRFSQKKFSEAQKLYGQALEKNPDNPAALQGLVNIDLAQKKPEQAIQLVNAQIAKAPNSSAYYLLLAKVYVVNHNLSQAEAAASQALRLSKNNMEAYLLLGQIQSAQGANSNAVATYEQAIQTNPRDIRPYFSLAQLDDQMGNWEKAQGLYQKVLQIQPDFAPAQNNLAYLMIEHHQNLDVALSMAQSARRALPESPATADTLGCAYYQKGLYQLALGLLEEAAQKDPQDAAIHYHLGLTYAKLGNRAKAKVELERVLALNPKFKDADKVRQTLAELGQS